MRVHGLAPVADADARVLILGSMPGVLSLRTQQYYAHPQSAFWTIAQEVLGFAPADDYAARLCSLRRAGIALWDVVASCVREGSLDSAIDGSSIVPNDLQRFLSSHARIRLICFNGKTAANLYSRFVQPRLPGSKTYEYATLPSTSPANARIARAEKIRAWRVIRPGG
jgi:hypoxanthine-DNA glycosylase